MTAGGALDAPPVLRCDMTSERTWIRLSEQVGAYAAER